MGLLDDVSTALDNGMGAAERTGNSLKVQGELKRLEGQLNKAYAALGRAAYANPGIKAILTRELAGSCERVDSLLGEERELRKRLSELQSPPPSPKTAGKPARQYACPACGSPVRATDSYCAFCGDNLAGLKEGHRLCPSCEMLYTPDAQFCPNCGVRTIELPVAPKIDMTEPPVTPVHETASECQDRGETIPAAPEEDADGASVPAVGEDAELDTITEAPQDPRAEDDEGEGTSTEE